MNTWVVCAALRRDNGEIVCGPRHFDPTMRAAIGRICVEDQQAWRFAEQGFVDQRGNFLTREEAWPIALANGQIRRRCGGDDGKLFSENLY